MNPLKLNIQRRPRETLLEYEKRKKRLRAQGFGSGSMLKHSLPLIPQVVSSTAIYDPNSKTTAIVVTWDRPMIGNTDLKLAFTVKINGIIKPVTSVEFNPSLPNVMAIIIPIKTTDTVTWAYNDQHPTGEIKDQNGTEPMNQTYNVNNKIKTRAFTKGFTKGFR